MSRTPTVNSFFWINVVLVYNIRKLIQDTRNVICSNA